MIAAIAYRGPDETGFLVDGPVGLGHARLSIIDLAGGQQPMGNEDGSVQVVFNGEIFNYVELRAELVARGHTLATHSDTEVLVHLYEDHGDAFVDHLVGQFAIALWDASRRRLVLCRDRVGIRPLFWTLTGDRLLFASEVKALFAIDEVERRLDLPALGQALTFWAPVAPATPFDGVFALPPGHVMAVEDGRVGEPRPYWDWAFAPHDADEERPFDSYVEEMRALLADSVRLRLRSNVPVGAYLSGGLDSAIIAALVKQWNAKPLRTFSVRFEDDEFDEGRYQRALVARLGTDHTEVLCKRADIAAAFPRTVLHTEAPIVRTAPTPLMLLSARVREEGYKVVLTGEGADEVFAGYDLFKEARIRRFAAEQPGSSLPGRLLKRLYGYLEHSPTASAAFAQGFFAQQGEPPSSPIFAHLPRWQTTRRALRFLTPEARAAAADPIEAFRSSLPAAMTEWPPLCRDQYVEARTLLSSYLLSSQGDRMAMANSVEGRFPFLDHRLIELAGRLPLRFKMMGLNEKVLLKRAFADRLPPEVVHRTKQPYRAPDSQSFFVDGQPAEPYVGDLFSEAHLRKTGLFEPESTARLYEKCRRGATIGFADNMAFVGILSTLLLGELVIESPGRGPRPGAGEAREHS